jgi:hypothetical protein
MTEVGGECVLPIRMTDDSTEHLTYRSLPIQYSSILMPRTYTGNGGYR